MTTNSEATSQGLGKLANRAKEAAEKVSAAAAKDRAALESQVGEAGKAAKDKAAELNSKAEQAGDANRARWSQFQQNWDKHVTDIRADIDAKKADLDAKHLDHRAEDAELDAIDAIAFAEAAVEEAEYSALNAALARMDADEAAAAA